MKATQNAATKATYKTVWVAAVQVLNIPGLFYQLKKLSIIW
jgi:hypothetical protein